MNARQKISPLILFAIAIACVAPAQEKNPNLCGTRPTTVASVPSLSDTGGIYVTSKGILRALIVFGSFPDDTIPHPYWQPHQPPQFMQQFIDPDTNTRSSSPFNLTNYFRQMSLGKFHFVGEAIWVESNRSQTEYPEDAVGRANRHLLFEQVDPLIDFRQYDQWTRTSDYNHTKAPDSLVDMIIMVWRTNRFEYLGEASLGYWPGFTVDGIRIENGYPAYLPYPRGSGVTCQYVYTDNPYRAMQTMAHELGHWLLGKLHPYASELPNNKHAYWGMLCSNQRVASCVNAYERERLGWAVVPEIPLDQNISLTDFLTTGAAFKHHPVNGEPVEYFYIENHQLLSPLDDVTKNTSDKGVWILHQLTPYQEQDNFKITPSDGNWRWRNPTTTTQCFVQALPMFEKTKPLLAGVSHRDQIPNSTSAANWLFAFRDPSGQLQCGAFSSGERLSGSFNADVPILSSYSNPSTNTWLNQQTTFNLEVVSESNGVITLRSHSNPLTASPARRFLGVTAPVREQLALAWGAQWSDGQPLESDVNWSELQRQVGNDGNWISVYQGLLTQWTDESLRYDSSGTIAVMFRARVRDTQGKHSVWSNTFYAKAERSNSVDDVRTPTSYFLSENFPNPFNPSTSIEFHLPRAERVTLKLFTILGVEVRTVAANEELGAGIHRIQLQADNLPSGVYFYSLATSGFSQTRKMILLR